MKIQTIFFLAFLACNTSLIHATKDYEDYRLLGIAVPLSTYFGTWIGVKFAGSNCKTIIEETHILVKERPHEKSLILHSANKRILFQVLTRIGFWGYIGYLAGKDIKKYFNVRNS